MSSLKVEVRPMSEAEFGSKKVGLMLVVFATKPDDVGNRVTMVTETVERAMSMRRADERVLFSRIDVLVVADDRYPRSRLR